MCVGYWVGGVLDQGMARVEWLRGLVEWSGCRGTVSKLAVDWIDRLLSIDRLLRNPG